MNLALLIRRNLVIVGVVTALVLGGATVRAAAIWTAATTTEAAALAARTADSKSALAPSITASTAAAPDMSHFIWPMLPHIWSKKA